MYIGAGVAAAVASPHLLTAGAPTRAWSNARGGVISSRTRRYSILQMDLDLRRKRSMDHRRTRGPAVVLAAVLSAAGLSISAAAGSAAAGSGAAGSGAAGSGGLVLVRFHAVPYLAGLLVAL